jgi:hypothetical protein
LAVLLFRLHHKLSAAAVPRKETFYPLLFPEQNHVGGVLGTDDGEGLSIR